ncbi:MAG: LysE family translocator [Pseudomonadota bacterium]
MPPPELLLPFFAATLAFAFVPGPGLAYASAETLSQGCRAGLRAAIGFHLAGYVHIAAAAFGVAALIAQSEMAHRALTLAGACYLLWLGWRHFAPDNPATSGPAEARSLPQAFTAEVLNPKSALFFIAFLPGFTDPAATLPVWAQILILGSAVNLIFSAVDLGCIALAGAITARVARPGPWPRRIAGLVMVALGLSLAFG